MTKKSEAFGRDEMTALLGGGMQETLTRASVRNTSVPSKELSKEDVSTLTTAQTAALLKKQDLEKQQPKHQTGRLRAQKKDHVPQHIALLQEERQRLEERKVKEAVQDDEEEGDFLLRKGQAKRKRLEPQIVLQRQRVEPQVVMRRRRHESSSEDESNHGDVPQSTRRRHHADEASSSSSEEDDRRDRLLTKRRRQREEQQETRTTPEQEEHGKTAREVKTNGSEPVKQQPLHEKESQGAVNTTERDKEESESEDCSEDSTSSSSGDDDESTSDEEPVMAKPLFVPRHKRHTVITQEQKEREEEEEMAKKKEVEEKRKLKSRLMVAEFVAANHNGAVEEQDEDEGGGATNPMPDDTDPTDPEELERLRDAWEVREIERLLQAQDLKEQEEAERAEYERRRAMTDGERMREDEALGRYQRPGVQRRQKNKDDSRFMQRYYHRGAFYMDEAEWGEDDVRRNAKEYERAATGEDKVDKRNLPKVMQVKKFGFARQNTKYKGLAAEDTTDRNTELLPLVQKNKKHHPDHEKL